MTRCLNLLFFLFAACASTVQAANIVTLAKGGFTLTYDCDNRTALRYEYTLTTDTGSAARPASYHLDPDLPSGCNSQFTTSSYGGTVPGWNRGHLVTSNHMDYSSTYIRRANYMSNIVPQAESFNSGIWNDAENVAECYRDLATVHVYGGVVYNDTSNDFFTSSHGIRTPDYFWKTLITTDTSTGATKAISWYIPNRNSLGKLDSYIVSIDDLEAFIGAGGVGIFATPAVKTMKPATTWPLPANCNLG